MKHFLEMLDLNWTEKDTEDFCHKSDIYSVYKICQ